LNLIALTFYFHLVLLVYQYVIVILSENMLLLYLRLECLEQILPHMILFSFNSYFFLFNNIFRIHLFL